MPKSTTLTSLAVDNESTTKKVIFQFWLVFAGALALVVALVYFFPDHSGNEISPPDTLLSVLGP